MIRILKNTIFFSILILFVNFLFSQSESDSTKNKIIEIIHSNSMEYDENISIEANRLLGDVVFTHDEAFMFCDSAYFYKDDNKMIAYGDVKITRGDTLLIICKKLEYDGNKKKASMKDSIILKHYHSYLLTNFLDYDRNTEIAYYHDGGIIIDSINKLVSRRGYYYVNEKDYYAVDTVVLTNPDYIIYSDTMKYNISNEIADFFGKTDIISDSNYIYCEKGFYNTHNNTASISGNAWLRSGSNYLYGDSIYYDRKIKFGKAFQNVSIIDTVENLTANGNYAYYYEEPENAMITDSLLVTYVTKENDSIFLHSDTIRITTDTANNKLLRAYNKVQIFKDDLQARCDSLTFFSLDSIIHFYKSPIVWAEGNKQAVADHIYAYLQDKKPKFFYLNDNALIIENIDSVFFNQVSCNKIKATLTDNKMDSVNCYNNVKTIYYIPEEDEEIKDTVIYSYNQSNYLTTDSMTVFILNDALDHLWIYGKTDAYMYPIDQIPTDKYKLENFLWFDKYRPKIMKDIFIWKEIE